MKQKYKLSPTTGREGLYINRMFTTRFSNMSILESKPLLESLFNQMEAHDITCRFKWDKGDVLIWDNHFTLHYPINDFSGVRRKMVRTSILEIAVQ
jgi:taurine dioxygenase